MIRGTRYSRIKDIVNFVNSDGKRICRNCDNIVSKNRRYYCSEKCMNEFLINNNWYYVRNDILRRDKFKCQICNKRFRKSLLEVDHIIPVRVGINVFDKNNLRTLCKECHKSKTRLEKELF